MPLSDDAGLTPDQGQVYEAFAMAAAGHDHDRHCSGPPGHDPDAAACQRWSTSLHRRPGWDLELVEALDQLWRESVSDSQFLAQAALAIVASQAIRADAAGATDSAERTRRLGAHAAELLVSDMARRLGYALDSRAWPRIHAMLAHTDCSPTIVAPVLADAMTDRIDDHVNVLLLTPLGTLLPRAQQDLLDVARHVVPALADLHVRVDVPGLRLGPDEDHRWTKEQMYAADRRRVLEADIVFVVAAQHDSWGAAQCVTWAEGHAPVYVYTTKPENLSRVLGNGPYRTRVVPWDSSEEVARSIASLVRRNIDALTGAARQRVANRRQARASAPALKAALQRHGAEQLGPTRRRVAMAAAIPGELDSLTISELRSLAAHSPEQVDRLIRGVTGIWRHRELSPRELAHRDRVCHLAGATVLERWTITMQAMEQPAVQGQLVGNRQEMTEYDWDELLRKVRGS